jgi:PhzF family phenazine biosynthesis protein
MNKEITTYIVDSFTDEAFRGNPAGVCIVETALSVDLMGNIAKELGLSETAFVQKGKTNFSIRYFSPKMEIPLCGHATLAASKVLFERDDSLASVCFLTIEGIELNIQRAGTWIEMNFPVYSTVAAEVPNKLLKALGIDEIIGSEYNKETNILLIEIANSKALRRLDPDFQELIKSHDTINGVLVTASSDQDEFDFESRYFWPWSGTNEDPVTGATHTFLSPYWSKKLNKNKLRSFQCSERSGFMELELQNSNTLIIKGKAKIVLEGKMRIV